MKEGGIRTGAAMDHMGGLAAMMDNAEVLPSEKMHHLLGALQDLRTQTEQVASPFKATIEAVSLEMGEAIGELLRSETTIKAAIEDLLYHEFKDEDSKYKGKAGSAQIIKPDPTISYDKKGLETLRLSSDEMQRIIGHLRTEKPRDPYLRVKLAK